MAGDGRVSAYYDFGGGVLNHKATFPTYLTKFCFCRSTQPAIVLSHWDWDHWSSQGRDATALQSDWIAPHQRVGPVHFKFASQLHASGRLLKWPAGLASVSLGPTMTIDKCTGSGRNHSGLAIAVTNQPAATDKMLLPADARYNVIPGSAANQYLHVVVTHHGGRHRTTAKTPSASQLTSAAACSFGSPNSYGHPNAQALNDLAIAGYHKRRDTANRTPHPCGHIGLFWTLASAAPALPCGANCQLNITQF